MFAIVFLVHIRFCSYYRVGLGVVQMVRYFKTSQSIRVLAPLNRYFKSELQVLQVKDVKTDLKVKVQKHFMSMHCFIIVVHNSCNTSEATYNTLHLLNTLTSL